MSYAIRSGSNDSKDQQKIVVGDGPNLDAFSRLRISNYRSQFEQTLEFGVGQLFWNTTSSGGSSAIAHDPDTSTVVLTCGTESDAYVIRQTYDYFRYRPGKSHFFTMTGVFGSPISGVVRRCGFYDTDDGIFFEQTGTDYAFVVRTSTSGTTSDTVRIAQASWNLDPLDGTGPSSITLDGSKGFVLVVDLQWLGFGRVRCGFDINGQIIYVHEFVHANSSSLPYMKTANLPLRYEIRNTSAQGSTHTFRQSCASVGVEGGGALEERALNFSVGHGTTVIGVTTRRAILSIRPKATVGPSSKVNRININADTFSILTTGNDAYFEIVYNPTLTTGGGALTWGDPHAQSAIEYCLHGDANAGAFTGGIVLTSGYISSGLGASALAVVQAELKSKLPLTLDMNGENPIVLSIAVTSMTGTSNNSAALSWAEIR